MGFTSADHPFVILPLVGLDINGFLRTLSKEDIVRVVFKLIEYHVNMAYDYSKANGYNSRQFVALIDMDQFSVRQFLTKQGISQVYLKINFNNIFDHIFI